MQRRSRHTARLRVSCFSQGPMGPNGAPGPPGVKVSLGHLGTFQRARLKIFPYLKKFIFMLLSQGEPRGTRHWCSGNL